jgi:mRNA interferase MazF
MLLMRRGEIWWVRFGPGIGGEIQKERPAVIVSNDEANKYMNRVQVMPLSTQVHKVYPSEALVTVRGKMQKAMADQLTTADKSRFKNRMGRLSASELLAVEQAIRVQLELP